MARIERSHRRQQRSRSPRPLRRHGNVAAEHRLLHLNVLPMRLSHNEESTPLSIHVDILSNSTAVLRKLISSHNLGSVADNLVVLFEGQCMMPDDTLQTVGVEDGCMLAIMGEDLAAQLELSAETERAAAAERVSLQQVSVALF